MTHARGESESQGEEKKEEPARNVRGWKEEQRDLWVKNIKGRKSFFLLSVIFLFQLNFPITRDAQISQSDSERYSFFSCLKIH